MSAESHDTTNIRVSNRFNFYAPAIFVGSIPIVGLPLLLFFIWLCTHWADALLLSAVVVYGVAGVTAVFFICVTCLIIAFTLSRIHHWNNKSNLLVSGDVVVLLRPGGEFEHLSALHEQAKLAIPPPLELDATPDISDEHIIELHNKGISLRNLEKYLDVPYHRLQRVTSQAKQK